MAGQHTAGRDGDDLRFMTLALKEAVRGLGRTSPNPCVGAILVREGRVVGRGYHRKAGTPHAEINALRDAGEAARGATLYVTLEPCNHTGRTPPCSQAVVRAGIRRVVIGLEDPNPVATGGIEYLRSHGLEVVTGVCREQCLRLVLPFLKLVACGQPWVVMKAGLSLDGRISYRPGQGGAITGSQSRHLVHLLRDRLDAILIGVGTALIDNPSLTTRLDDSRARDPLRVILDSGLRLNPDCCLLNQQSTAETWIFCTQTASATREQMLSAAGARIVRVAAGRDGRVDPGRVVRFLGENGVGSLLVEGGATVHGAFLAGNLVDEVYLFMAPFFIGDQGTALVRGYGAGQQDRPPALQSMRTLAVGRDLLLQGVFPARVPQGTGSGTLLLHEDFGDLGPGPA